MKNHLWRLKQKLGQHGKLNPRVLHASLEPTYLKRFDGVCNKLGCKPAEALRLIVQDWLSNAQSDEAEVTHPAADQITSRLDELTRSISELAGQVQAITTTSPNGAHPAALTPSLPAALAPTQTADTLPSGPVSLETLHAQLDLLRRESDANSNLLLQNMLGQYVLMEQTTSQVNHIHALQNPLMGAVWSTLMMVLNYIIRKDGSVTKYGEDKVSFVLPQIRDFYAQLGMDIVMEAQRLQDIPSRFAADDQSAFRLYKHADNLMADRMKKST